MCLTVGLFLLGARSEGLCVQFLVFRPKKKNCVSKEFILCNGARTCQIVSPASLAYGRVW